MNNRFEHIMQQCLKYPDLSIAPLYWEPRCKVIFVMCDDVTLFSYDLIDGSYDYEDEVAGFHRKVRDSIIEDIGYRFRELPENVVKLWQN